MSKRRTIGVWIVLLTFAVPDLLACGDKLLMGRFGTRLDRPKNARAASVLMYANPAMAATIKKADIEKLLKLESHKTTKVQTFEELSTIVSTGHFDVILTAKGDSANVEKLLQSSPDASAVLAVDDLLKKKHSLLDAIDKAVVQRDKNLKKTVKR